MARNQEKAQTMLARWLRYKEEEVKGPKKRRPYLAELCDDLHEAEKWRGTIIKDISRNVAEIQNASLGEHRIRDLNDRINKLFREKRHWERRIRTLGGKDYKFRSRGYGGYGHGAYLYFGAAKDLPGVRDLLQKESTTTTAHRRKQIDRVTGSDKKSRTEMLNMVDADYYGFGDDDDNELFWREKEMEQKLRRAKMERWRRENEQKWKEMQRRKGLQTECGSEIESGRRMTRSSSYVPSQQEIDAMILEKRKQILMAKYTSNDGQSDAAKSLAQRIRINEAQRKLLNPENSEKDQ